MCLVKKIFGKFKKVALPIFSLSDTFGCPETPPPSCPTFIERNVHRRFRSAVVAHNIIVVYGESRQGKTWTIDKYCPQKFRIGCTAAMDLMQIKKEMLCAVGVEVRQVEHSVTQQMSTGAKVTSAVGMDMLARAGVESEVDETHIETLKTTYPTVDFSIDAHFLQVLAEKAVDGWFVFDNFHYLPTETQKQFCSLLKEFNYRNIKVVIVGVWKDASRITALASDLVDRCEHIDIGSWSEAELKQVVKQGERALNIAIDPGLINTFVKCSANNIGIFKTYLRKYCDKSGVFDTQEKCRKLCDEKIAMDSIDEAVSEAFNPLCDRLRNLATPRRERSDGKRMRLKIICAVLNIISKKEAEYSQNGIPLQDLLDELDEVCLQLNEKTFDRSNVTQELLKLHEREENRDVRENLIPLFFYDKLNRKLLIIDPAFYQAKAYNSAMLQSMVEELMGSQPDQITMEAMLIT